MADHTAYLAEISQYDQGVDEDAVRGIVNHLGIALRSRDSSMVAASDPLELARLRDGFIKKRLGVTDSDSEIDSSIKEVMQQMSGDRTKSRVTVCYLLAKKYGKLDQFRRETMASGPDVPENPSGG